MNTIDLLEMEQMGGKIRDTDDEYVGAEGRYDDKLMFCPRLGDNLQARFEKRVPAARRENLRPRYDYQPADRWRNSRSQSNRGHGI